MYGIIIVLSVLACMNLATLGIKIATIIIEKETKKIDKEIEELLIAKKVLF